ncbi:MAG: hypothetical protein IPK79_13035 [Vampirovibrionales bacterium]|nr:hypothetical protein [Vampirovibrionales bacterium]
MEYTHILTQGKRLEKLLSEQVQQRLEDSTRTIEVKILRASSLITSLNGEIEVGVLLDILGISPEEGLRSLSRLLKEHLVKEKSPGILGGLHNLRSSALARLTHDELVIQTEDSLLQSIRAVTTASLPLIIQAVLREPEKFNRLKLIDALVSLQKEQNTVETMTAILTGLGFASLEVRAKQFIQLLEEWNIERSLWSVTAMFAVAKGVEFPDLPSVGEGWNRLKELVQHFHSTPLEDFRITFLDKIHVFPALEGLDTLQLLLASMVNMSHFPSFDLNILDAETNNYCIRKISKVLETAYSVSPDFALSLSKSFGGEEYLLKTASEQISWIMPPIIGEEEHGRTVRADYQFISAQASDNMNDKAVEICKIIMALVPSSEAAACSFVDTNGMVIQIEGRPMMAKNIPRSNLPTEVVVAWNKALGYFIQSNANIISLSEYSTVMSSLITRTESVFREVTEKWIRGVKFNNQEQIAEELNSIVQACNGLSFTMVPSLLGSLKNASNLGISSDTIGTLLTSILNNLIPRLCAVSQKSEAQAVASFSLHLSEDAQKCTSSTIWRMLDDTPADQLIAISERLEYLSEILQEFAAQYEKDSIELAVAMAKRASFGKSIAAASKFSKNRGEHRLKKTLECLLRNLKEEGIEGEYKTVPLKKNDGIYWPAVEIAIIMTISELEELNKLETVIQIAKEALDEKRIFTVVPKLNGKIISNLAMKIYPTKSLPDVNFNDIWLPEFQEQVLKSKIIETFSNAMSSAYDISAIC